MAAMDDLIGVQDASRLLQISTWQVQHLGRTGDLTFVARGQIDRASLERLVNARRGSHTRGWAEHTAWAAIALLAGHDPHWLGTVQRSRLRSTLRTSDVSSVVARARHRAVVRTFTGHTSVAARLRPVLITANRDGLGLVFTGLEDALDGYLPSGDLDRLTTGYALREDPHGQYTLRSTMFDLDDIRALAQSSTGGRLLAAFDAAGSLDPRERGVGEHVIAQAMDELKAAS